MQILRNVFFFMSPNPVTWEPSVHDLYFSTYIDQCAINGSQQSWAAAEEPKKFNIYGTLFNDVTRDSIANKFVIGAYCRYL